MIVPRPPLIFSDLPAGSFQTIPKSTLYVPPSEETDFSIEKLIFFGEGGVSDAKNRANGFVFMTLRRAPAGKLRREPGVCSFQNCYLRTSIALGERAMRALRDIMKCEFVLLSSWLSGTRFASA